VSIFRKVIEFYKDPDYFSNIQKIALPIIIQQLMFSGLNMLGVILIGQKGDASVAAVGLAVYPHVFVDVPILRDHIQLRACHEVDR